MDIAVEDLVGGITKVVLRGRFDTTGAIPPEFRRPTGRRRSRGRKSAISASISRAALRAAWITNAETAAIG